MTTTITNDKAHDVCRHALLLDTANQQLWEAERTNAQYVTLREYRRVVGQAQVAFDESVARAKEMHEADGGRR